LSIEKREARLSKKKFLLQKGPLKEVSKEDKAAAKKAVY